MDMVRSEEGVQKRIAFRASIGRTSIPDGNLGEQMQRVITHGPAAPANHNTHGSRQGLWRTPSVAEEKNQNTSTQIYLQNQVGATPKAWATPIQGDSHLASTPEVAQKRIEEGKVTLSRQMAAQWGTPAANDANKTPHCEVNSNQAGLAKSVGLEMRNSTGKLNPRWVETLMGLPIGWVMPSCASPVTIEPTNSGSWETELSPQPQSELFEF
jgi:hypothetical protein